MCDLIYNSLDYSKLSSLMDSSQMTSAYILRCRVIFRLYRYSQCTQQLLTLSPFLTLCLIGPGCIQYSCSCCFQVLFLQKGFSLINCTSIKNERSSLGRFDADIETTNQKIPVQTVRPVYFRFGNKQVQS